MEQNTETLKRWKGTFGELEEKGEVLMKWGDEGKYGYIYNTVHKVGNEFYHATLGPDESSEGRFDAVVIPAYKAIEFAVESLPFSQYGSYLSQYFSDDQLNDYKRVKGWSPEYSLEEISGYRSLAEMAVTQLAGNIEMKLPAGSSETSAEGKLFQLLISQTIDGFIEKTAKDFSHKMSVSPADLVKTLESNNIIVANAGQVSQKDTSFYCAIGKNNAQYLYKRGDGGLQLVASTKTVQNLPIRKEGLLNQISKGMEM